MRVSSGGTDGRAGAGIAKGANRFNEAVAATVTRVTTSMWFLYGLVCFVGLWMDFAPRFGLDQAPSFPVMLYWVNLFQAVMLPVLAVGQSVLSRAGEARQRHEAEVVDRLDHLTHRILKLEEENATLLQVRHQHHQELLGHIHALSSQVRGLDGPARPDAAGTGPEQSREP